MNNCDILRAGYANLPIGAFNFANEHITVNTIEEILKRYRL